MITPFYGELFMYPIPLELSHNYCSNKCNYCFANNNLPTRKANPKKVSLQLKKFNEGSSIVSKYLQNKMAICISNKTDPFSKSNYRVAIPEIKTLLSLDIPVAYHTRGGVDFDNFYKNNNIPKSFFYISICQSNESDRIKNEPGATSLDYRWSMAKNLIDDGHQVVLGLNPFVSQWINQDDYIKKIVDNKITNVIIQPMHLSILHLKNMSANEKTNLGENILKSARKKHSDQWIEVDFFIKKLVENKINYYDNRNFNKTNIFKAWHNGLNNKTFMTYFDFYNWCLLNKKDCETVFFDDFYNFVKPEFINESEKINFQQYITSMDRRYLFTRKNNLHLDCIMTFKELCKVIWNDLDSPRNLTRSKNFSLIGEIKNNVLYSENDEDNNYIYAFNSNSFEDRIVNIDLINN